CVAEWFAERRMIRYTQEERLLILEEICTGATRYKEIRERVCLPLGKDALSWEEQRFVEQMAPERYTLPRGGRMRIEYQAGKAPRGGEKLRDLEGMGKTPPGAGGREMVLVKIRAPNRRPDHLPDARANFGTNLYPTWKKGLSRRYPRHEWR